jgi:hypothetical protein
MIKQRMHTLVTGINRFWDLLPEPLVLRALQGPDAPSRPHR